MTGALQVQGRPFATIGLPLIDGRSRDDRRIRWFAPEMKVGLRRPDVAAENVRMNLIPREPPITGKSQLPQPRPVPGTDWFALGGLTVGTIATVSWYYSRPAKHELWCSGGLWCGRRCADRGRVHARRASSRLVSDEASV